MILRFVTGVLAAVCGTAADASDLCALARAPGAACAATPRGAVLAADAAEAARIAEFASAGETRFIRHFGRAPAPYVIAWGVPVDGAATRARLKVVFAFPTAEQRVSREREAARKGVEVQLRAAGLPEAQVAAQAEQTLASIPLKSPDALRAADKGLVPHELGHLWFHQAFWPAADKASKEFYVTPAPDWLDEAAAVLMEGEAAGPAFDHRAAFIEALADPQRRAANLPALFAREHPGQKLKTIMAAGAPANGWDLKQLKALGVDADAIPAFYAQSAMFTRFLIERSGDQAILGDLAAWMSRGGTLETWLAAHGRRHRLGATTDELEALWMRWVVRIL